jgi:hypothetical protein
MRHAGPTIVIAAGAAILAACGHVPPTGNVALDVTVNSDVAFRAVSYQIISAIGLHELSGGIETAQPSTSFTRFISHVPADKGYVITVDARSTNGEVGCTGSAGFDVRARWTTQVNLSLSCKGINDGMIHIAVGVDCPAFQVASYTVSPLTASVGGTIAVSAMANVAPDAAVSFLWTASSGTFADSTQSATTYTCTSSGASTLTLSASMGPCRASKSIMVACVTDAGAD